MNELQSRYGRDGLAIVAVNLDQDRRQAEKFLRDTPAEFRVEYDADGALANALHVAAMPTSFLIDRHGRVVEQHAGFREAQRADREAEIAHLLKASAP
jgi:peroxiredoxin